MKTLTAEQTAERLRAAAHVRVVCHTRPDGDTIGSAVALTMGLRHAGVAATAWCDETLPLSCRTVSGVFETSRNGDAPCDLIVFVDFSTPSRAGADLGACDPATPVLVIDHHPFHDDVAATWCLHDTRAAATGCLVFDVLAELGAPIDGETADALYLALATDTGNFTYSNTNRRVFEIMLALMDAGIDIAGLASRINDCWRVQRLRLLAHALDTLTLVAEGRGAYMYLSDEMFRAAGATQEDSDDFVNFARALATVRVAAMFTENRAADETRVNVRSKDAADDVSAYARAWGGGGHACAAGARAAGPLADNLDRLRASFEEFAETGRITTAMPHRRA